MQVVLAILVALAVPVGQLRVVTVVMKCCCPDPASCHCPDHKKDHSSEPTMKACHKTSHAVAPVQAPAFVAPERAVAAEPARAVARVLEVLPSPHAAPPPARPDAPS